MSLPGSTLVIRAPQPRGSTRAVRPRTSLVGGRNRSGRPQDLPAEAGSESRSHSMTSTSRIVSHACTPARQRHQNGLISGITRLEPTQDVIGCRRRGRRGTCSQRPAQFRLGLSVLLDRRVPDAFCDPRRRRRLVRENAPVQLLVSPQTSRRSPSAQDAEIGDGCTDHSAYERVAGARRQAAPHVRTFPRLPRCDPEPSNRNQPKRGHGHDDPGDRWQRQPWARR